MKIYDPKWAALTASLAALAAAGRIPFAALPSVQPTTFIVIIAGWALGPVTGAIVGIVATLASNMFLGQGPWTLFQAVAWGLAGLFSGWLGMILPRPRKWFLAGYAFIWGYLFGWITNLHYWLLMVYPHTWQSFIAAQALSFWFDTAHALTNLMFCWLGGVMLLQILLRYKRRLDVDILP